VASNPALCIKHVGHEPPAFLKEHGPRPEDILARPPETELRRGTFK